MKRIILHIHTFCLLTLLCPAGLAAQSVIRGIVIDRESQLPVEAATVQLTRGNVSLPINYTLSNNEGTFTLTQPKRTDSLLVSVSLLGYQTQQQAVHAGQTLRFEMEPQVFSLKEVEIRPGRVWGQQDTIIFDIRDNGGGMLSNADRIASRFLEEKILTGYIQHKTGKGHDDFSEPYPLYLSPSERIRWLRPVVVLTNRHCYSAANDFVQKVRMMPYVTTMGDRTGGGSGFPFNSELPNGWGVRFSASPMLDVNKQHTEFGIDPTYKVSMTQEDIEKGKDTIIEAAITHLLSETEKK